MSMVRHPKTLVPACSSTSIRRSRRVSWSLMPGILPQPYGMGQRETLKQGEIDVYVERRGLKCRKAVGDCVEGTAHLIEIVETLVEAEILEIVAKCLQPQKGGELLVHPHHRVLGVGA